MLSTNMQKLTTPFIQTGRFSKIITDYLNADNVLSPYYTYAPDSNNFELIIKGKQEEFLNRAELVEVLEKQYANTTTSSQVKNNIQAFGKTNTFCIVTAHQLNIFTGPLYVIYKTVSAIKLCSTLQQQFPQYQFVPVFWLGSEDHDFEEINHTSVFGKSFTWEDKQGGACGEYSTTSIAELCNTLFEAIGDGPHAASLKNIFTAAYLHGHNLAHATRILLNSLFQDYGLVIVDGNDTQFKANCATIMQDELFNQSSEKIVNEVLATFPYEAQAKPRNVNLFYLQPNLRERIIYHSDKDIFEINNTTITFSTEQLKKEILLHPENFSPNVILRPLFQQKVLPSLAYIGGGGEIAYWLQLKSLFEYHHIQFPMLLLRDSFLLVDEAAQKKLNKLEISVDHLFGEEQHVIADYVKTHSSDAINLDAEKTAISELFSGIITKATSIDTSLDKAVKAEQQAVMTSFAKLEAKLLKAEKAKMEVEINQIKGLLTKLFPNGGLQERSENFTAWYLKFGPDFIKMLLENAQQPVNGFASILVSSN